MSAARVMIVDDHPVVREGYKRLLETRGGLVVVAEAGDVDEALRKYVATGPDISIVDLSLPGLGGLEAVRRIRSHDRRARIVVFTMHQGAALAVKAFEAGARGYVTKSSEPGELVRAVEAALAGRLAVSPDIAEEIALQKVLGNARSIEALTPRQVEVLRLIAAGLTTEAIAEALSISTKTARNMRSQIRDILDARTDAQLVWIAIEMGLTIPDWPLEGPPGGR